MIKLTNKTSISLFAFLLANMPCKSLAGWFSPDSSEEFSDEGCEFSVKFPIKPVYQETYVNDKKRILAITKNKQPTLRAECASYDFMGIDKNQVTNETMINGAKEAAEFLSIKNPEVRITKNPKWITVYFCSRKNMQNIDFTFCSYTNYGEKSAMVLWTIEQSSNYPSNESAIFVNSLKLK